MLVEIARGWEAIFESFALTVALFVKECVLLSSLSISLAGEGIRWI